MKSEIQEQIEMTTEELLFKIGNENSSGAINFDPIEKGKEIYENLKVKFKETICLSPEIKMNFIDGDRFDKISMIVALIDLIATMKIPVSPITFCVLLVKEGLDTYCKSEWYE